MKVRASSPRLLLRRDDLFRLGVNTGPQRGCIFTKGPAELLGYATSESPAAISTSMRRRNSPAKASNAPGRHSLRWMLRCEME